MRYEVEFTPRFAKDFRKLDRYNAKNAKSMD